MTETLRKRWIGDRSFYKTVLTVALPIMLQMLITNFVNMLDNIMVGQVGTLPMSGVSISNQLLFIFNLAMFGTVNAVGIFSAQFFGRKDYDGVRSCFWLKVTACLILSAAGICIFILFGEQLAGLYMDGSVNNAQDVAATMAYSRQYMMIMLTGMVPFALTQCVSSSLKEAGETVVPMRASFAAVGVNFVFNWLLIFGHFGFPKMGIAGAALATVLSRFTELVYVSLIAIRSGERFPFFQNLTHGIRITSSLVISVLGRGLPLILNEVFWSMGVAATAQCYSTRGLNAVAAYNISNTVNSLFIIICISMGNAIAILVGQKLGAGEDEEAVDMDRKMIVLSAVLSGLFGIVMAAMAPVFPALYNTSEAVRAEAAQLIRIGGLLMANAALYNSSYFTLRSGGKTVITFLFDSVFTCLVSFSLAFVLSRYTQMTLPQLFLSVQLADVLKSVIGLWLVEKRVWVHNLVAGNA